MISAIVQRPVSVTPFDIETLKYDPNKGHLPVR